MLMKVYVAKSGWSSLNWQKNIRGKTQKAKISFSFNVKYWIKIRDEITNKNDRNKKNGWENVHGQGIKNNAHS